MNEKIAFYIKMHDKIEVLKNKNLDEGNPGVGGTQYLFLLTIKYLNKIYANNSAILITDGNIGLEDIDIPYHIVNNMDEAFIFCKDNNIKKIVLNANIVSKINDYLYSLDLDIILWAHNTLSFKGQKIAAEKDSIFRVVCVSESQYQNMKDSACFKKCIYINNVITNMFYKNAIITDYSEKKVVYVGSAMPQKGMHNLLDIWRIVEKKEPEAQLYIIGGAKIWNRKTVLGSLNVGDKYYDKLLCNKLKKIKNKNNIHFLGAMGWGNIKEVIKSCRVGVVNPSYYVRDETFCMSAIELETYGIPVVSRNRNDGLKTTIIDGKTGFLKKYNSEIADRIVYLLDDYNCKKIGVKSRNHAKEFIIEKELKKWKDLCSCERIKSNHSAKISKDSIYLCWDNFLKFIFVIRSGKVFFILKRKLMKI
ncbi:glycosyltransferase family 4 protein [Clostridium perfringens]|uniref:glycosyltransferase family 4 protein n=1 Tax=Clostridium perfringens TaxID=1502 RepID=UPI001C87B310|nr:glycosyltransferase family 4 protein [Clostridium perfringens]MDK0849476.1 glycosyltransferase family 4 protein [Clostridium perfringens]MDK0866971.1 glycosyltransferase family 4 protein [Clostridium perfringens]HBI6967435.1 glycosyltransferase family 4 protein [Clostridium perfringens]HBI6970683.1 glycosyltransferase family 4 protein [Clostridium perfringens]HBI6987481.1 glycosyltransferase family 4 protein [Clostridium perfringens]